jgi:biopolymer transport protein ExbD
MMKIPCPKARRVRPDLEAGSDPPSPPAQREEEDLIDMTAMVDIVFFLLIFFMVTSMHANQAAIAVPPVEQEPKNRDVVANGPKSEVETITVRIEADNTVLVNDEESPSRQDLIARLRDEGESQMVVRAHAEASHGKVVMVLDAGTDAGVDDVRLITEDDSSS